MLRNVRLVQLFYRTLSTAAAPAITVLDGGMGHELRRRGVVIEGPLGSQQRFLGVALANVEQPALVTAAHTGFLAAGAEIITTNNYAVVPNTLALTGGKYGDGDLEALTAASAMRAREAVAQQQASGGAVGARVAGSLPPLRESYQHAQVPKDAAGASKMQEAYRRIATSLAPHVDVLLCETMSCAREAVAAVRGAMEGAPQTELWVAWTLAEDDSGTLRSGETVEQAVAALEEAGVLGHVKAGLFNCSLVTSVSAALPRLRAALPTTVEVGAYANAFVSAHSDGSGSDYDYALDPASYSDIVLDEWVAGGGATIVGGCCGIFPEHIGELAKRVGKRDERGGICAAEVGLFGRARRWNRGRRPAWVVARGGLAGR